MSATWNHGKISRNAAEQLLVANGIDGAFLVRQSESVNDAHVLSLWFDGMVHHFRILKNANKFVVQASCSSGGSTRFFSTLDEVIELFKQPGQGLPHKLEQPIFFETIKEIDEHETDDEEEDGEIDIVDGPVDMNTDISSVFFNKMEELDTSCLDSDFCNNVRSYLSGGFERDGEKLAESRPAAELQKLVVASAVGLKRELKVFLERIEFLQKLFCTNDEFKKLLTGIGAGTAARQSSDVSEYCDLVKDFGICVAGMKSLEILAKEAHKEYGILTNDEQSQTRTFEVTSCGNFKTKSYLKVDITGGKLWFMRNENDSLEDSSIVEHDKILQVVKDPAIPKLTIKIPKGNREHLFKDTQARENLCQLVQHMMNTHDPTKKEPKRISIFVGTWNMGGAAPPLIESWLKCNGTGEKRISDQIMEVVGHDIYAIGTQESSVGEANWVSKIKRTLKKLFKIDYNAVASHSLWGIRLVILAKQEHTNRICRVEKSSVKTGIANTLGNKGGVGISFEFLSTSLCFINCHLTSGNEDLRKQRRQQNYLDILKGLNLGHKSAYDLTNQFHHVFWFGDLNYRIDLEYEEIMKAISSMDYKKLSSEDQLRKEKEAGNVFVNFHESVPHFPPTYRYKRGTRESYEHIKIKRAAGNRINVPSWCDRVLWTSFPELNVMQNSYGCTNDIVSSDHSPVFASFDVPITSQFVASPDQGRPKSQTNKPSCKINIPFIKVKVKTVSKTDFYLEFHSVCLATSERSKTGKDSNPWEPPRAVNSNPTLTSYLAWNAGSALPELNPILDNPEYLREQHILIAVKSEAGDESYGECVLSLKAHLFQTPQCFQLDLTHGGVKAGEIRGSMNILNTKQLAALRRPPVHTKPDTGGKTPNSPKTAHRPFSCIASNNNGTILTPQKKSASLGRVPPDLVPRRATRPSAPTDTTNISTYISLPSFMPDTASNDPSDQGTINNSLKPPPLPAKTSKTLPLPRTVGEFLSNLGLETYLPNLVENGFEDISFLEPISDEDLADSGITDVGHIKKILGQVESLRKAGVFKP
ncbi:phosphatidylinositol 3,4,5-trisphosphate 5-phosphatase 2A-like isoform X2 [Dendronephthya gigantea]|uniref:phosphatidylinositol 3,4,5-trisphosphate 5-phosphatase 2A-like isoform X2 n=1 Tax=Dendronephthya gigantea TaxID=151771 RepID=UPI00106C8121|nr:phosphatidylinositol 3,4,5-trisphosphate 5-phosphatase 2A-like isoform X2 [Dendronephthya gigantea]